MVQVRGACYRSPTNVVRHDDHRQLGILLVRTVEACGASEARSVARDAVVDATHEGVCEKGPLCAQHEIQDGRPVRPSPDILEARAARPASQWLAETHSQLCATEQRVNLLEITALLSARQ